MAKVNVYGELNCAEVDGKLARTDQIYDYAKGKYQSEINDSMLTTSKSDIEEAILQLETTLDELQEAEASAVSDAQAEITVAKNAAISEIEEVVQTVDITYETIEGENVQLETGGGSPLMPKTYSDNVYKRSNEVVKVQGSTFINNKYWGVSGQASANGFSCCPTVFQVAKDDVITFKNYRKYASATGGGPLCTIYNSSDATSGTRYNVNDYLVVDPSDSTISTFTVPQDGWIGINLGSAGATVKSQFYFTYVAPVLTAVSEIIDDINDEIDGIKADIPPLEYNPIDEKQVDVIIFMGQSNMGGRGVVNSAHPEDAPAVIDGAGYEFRAITDPTQLYPITKTFGKDENVNGAIDDGSMKTGGSVPAFVNSYFKMTLTPVIGVSASKGATTSNNWQPSGSLLPDAINRLTTCVAWLETNGYTIRHKYMAWCQGEADGDGGISAANYITRFTNIFNAMKAEGIEKCLMIQIGNYNGSTAGLAEKYEVIQGAQEDICASNDDVIMVSDSFRLMQARGLMKDQFHYYQDGYNIVGRQAGHNAGIYRNVSNLNKF